MSIEVKVPVLPESVADATIATWHKKVGDTVVRDENIVDLETDKVVLEVPAPQDGVLTACAFKVGDTVNTGQTLATIEPGHATTASSAVASVPTPTEPTSAPAVGHVVNSSTPGPAARRLLSAHAVDATSIVGSGKEGRITKQDVVAFIANEREAQSPSSSSSIPASVSMPAGATREARRVPMSRLRVKVAERLLEAQHQAAMLTTFNEVNLKAVMDLRTQYKDQFEKKHGVKLGFMSFFTRAVVESLKRFPVVNASIEGQDIVYHGYFDIGVAVSTERGLVVPVMRDANLLSMPDIEKAVVDFGVRARAGKLTLEELQGGTFTITNGGVFGSLLSTPIINPPQAAILGMHKIEERAVVINGQIVIRPMMYLALTYDHRLIDGKDSVQFLVSVKEFLEDPARLLLNL